MCGHRPTEHHNVCLLGLFLRARSFYIASNPARILPFFTNARSTSTATARAAVREKQRFRSLGGLGRVRFCRQSWLMPAARSARSGVCQFDQDIGVASFRELAGTRQVFALEFARIEFFFP